MVHGSKWIKIHKYQKKVHSLTLYKLFMSSDWNFDFPFSPFDAIPDRVDMLSAGNHLDETDPWNEPYCCEHSKFQHFHSNTKQPISPLSHGTHCNSHINYLYDNNHNQHWISSKDKKNSISWYTGHTTNWNKRMWLQFGIRSTIRQDNYKSEKIQYNALSNECATDPLKAYYLLPHLFFWYETMETWDHGWIL